MTPISATSSSRPPYSQQLLDLIRSSKFQRAVFGGKARLRKDTPFVRVVVRSVELSDGRFLQVSLFDLKKDVTANHPVADAESALNDVLAIGFANVHMTLTDVEYDIRLTKKGEVLTSNRPRTATAPTESHNRTKNLPLPEGRSDRLLEAMGIVDRMGRVRPTMQPKFTQINEFLKLLDHVLPEVTHQIHDRPLSILDCGCGASHLTLAVHHYLNNIKAIPATVLGIDVNQEVIRKSRDKAAELQCAGLEFKLGRIGSLTGIQPDIVLALHACDTATDDAMAQAIRSHAKLLLAVPCCHKHLNAQLDVPALRPIHRHGILHQRQADLFTDAFRALILRVMGYRADVIEFVSPEHSAKNLMIRAIKIAAPTPLDDSNFAQEYIAFKSFTGVTPYLEDVLSDLILPRLVIRTVR